MNLRVRKLEIALGLPQMLTTEVQRTQEGDAQRRRTSPRPKIMRRTVSPGDAFNEFRCAKRQPLSLSFESNESQFSGSHLRALLSVLPRFRCSVISLMATFA